ncbi:hypothetical protein D3C80_1551090 [compost metagenome]
MDHVTIGLEKRNGVVISPVAAAVQAQERSGRAILLVTFDDQVGGQHAQHVAVPADHAGHVGDADGDMPQAHDLCRSLAGPLYVAKAAFLNRRIEYQRRALRQCFDRLDTVHQFNAPSGWIM